MFPELEKNINLYKQLQEVETHLETVKAGLKKKRKLLESLVPWIDEKRADIEKVENGFRFNLFSNKEQQLDEIREEHHKMTLRAQRLQGDIDLLKYEKNILKEKRIQWPAVVYAFEKLAVETDLVTLDKKSRKILSAIKKCKKKQEKIIAKLKEAGIASDYALEIDQMINRLNALLRKSGSANQYDPIFGAMQINAFSRETNDPIVIELATEIAHKIELLSIVASKGVLIFDKNRTLAKIHQEDLPRILHGHLTNSKIFHVIKTYIETQTIVKRKKEELTLISNELKQLKESLEIKKHNLMLGKVR